MIWTLIPTFILVGMAIPATTTLMEIEDNSDADLTVLITGSQWKWHYQYVDAGFGYYSNLAHAAPADRQPRTEERALSAGGGPSAGAAHRTRKSVS